MDVEFHVGTRKADPWSNRLSLTCPTSATHEGGLYLEDVPEFTAAGAKRRSDGSVSGEIVRIDKSFGNVWTRDKVAFGLNQASFLAKYDLEPGTELVLTLA